MSAFVAPLAGAWIEIAVVGINLRETTSLPSRERGLKFPYFARKVATNRTSLPSRERGLKYCVDYILGRNHIVAPLAGAWIEIV